ncbi:hypothetical protein WA171_000536 [Blastocystis sp. BT1]
MFFIHIFKTLNKKLDRNSAYLFVVSNPAPGNAPDMPPQIVGYTMSQDPVALKAPTVSMGNSQVIETQSCEMENMDNDILRASLMNLVQEKSCWGKKAATDMEIRGVAPVNSFHCRWETYMEKRTTSWEQRPFDNRAVDSPDMGRAPLPWEVPVTAPNMFAERKMNVTVPHTEYVMECRDCYGRGRIQCTSCHGRGRENCTSCSGRGYRQVGETEEKCPFCNGMGTRTCNHCNGDGMTKCKSCAGSGRIVKYVNLCVEFVNHVLDEVIDVSGLPEEQIIKATGFTMCNQSGYHLLPPQGLASPELEQVCNRLYGLAENLINENTERLIQQRVTVRMVPVTKAIGLYKGKSFDFWVYGNDRKCYAPNYPMQCCCGCTTY